MEQWEKENSNRRRKKAETEALDDLRKSTEQLLVDIHDESLAEPLQRPYEQTIVRTTARFASLLTLIAMRSEVSARRSEVLQRWVIALTVALLVFTAGLVFVGVAQLRSSYVLEQVMKQSPTYGAPTNNLAPKK